MSELYTGDEPDQDLAAADAPHGFAFGGDADRPLLNALPADEFPPASEEAINGLLWLGYLTDSFTLFGHQFTIKTLTRGDRLAVAQVTKEWEETLGMGDAYQTATVAASLAMVDGEPVMSLGPSPVRATEIRKAFERVQAWYEPVVEAVFARTVMLNNRQIAAFTALQSK